MKHAFLSFESAYTSQSHRNVHSSLVQNNIQRAALLTPSMYRTSINNDKSKFACCHEAKFLFSGRLIHLTDCSVLYCSIIFIYPCIRKEVPSTVFTEPFNFALYTQGHSCFYDILMIIYKDTSALTSLRINDIVPILGPTM